MTKTFTQQAEEIKKGCGKEAVAYYKCGEYSNYYNKTYLCPECLAKAKALQEAGNGFLEFFINIPWIYDGNTKYKRVVKHIDNKIADIQNGLAILKELISK